MSDYKINITFESHLNHKLGEKQASSSGLGIAIRGTKDGVPINPNAWHEDGKFLTENGCNTAKEMAIQSLIVVMHYAHEQGHTPDHEFLKEVIERLSQGIVTDIKLKEPTTIEGIGL